MCSKIVVKFLVFLYLVNCNVAQDNKVSEEQVPTGSLADSMSWSCANNFECISNVANKVVHRVVHKKALDFGLFNMQPVKGERKGNDARTKYSFMDLINSYTLNVPVGPMELSMGRSVEHPNYLEVALSKRSVDGRANRRHMRFFIPAFLVISQLGWYALAIAGVKVLAIKAFLITKIALLVASIMTFRRIYDQAASSVIVPSYYDHHHEPFVMPYDFGHSYASAHHGHLGAESSINAVIDPNSVGAQHPGQVQVQQVQQLQQVAPVKANNREDVYYPVAATTARRPSSALAYNYVVRNPGYSALRNSGK